jgi:L-asparaginase II
VLAEVVRSGFVESRHRGSAVALGPHGRVVAAAGDVTSPIFPRSVTKVAQATAMVRAGLELDSVSLALAASSHCAEPFHLSGVRRILAGVGLDESALGNPPDLPLDEEVREEYLRAGGRPARIVMTCSGKHAAMLATCVVRGWPLESYMEADHPLQLAVRDTLAELAGERVSDSGADGCGVPLFAISLTGLARIFRAHVLAAEGTPERRVADAMRRHPHFVGGSHRDDSQLMAAIPGLLAKNGAEGVYAFALPDGRAAAIKIDDGALRAAVPVAVGLLRSFGVEDPVLDEVGAAPVRSGDEVVGEIRAVELPTRR